MTKMSSTDTIIHSAQALIHVIYNPEPASPLVKLINLNKEELIYLADIFVKATSPAVPPKVPVRGSYQEKIQLVNQEETQIKNSRQSKQPFTSI